MLGFLLAVALSVQAQAARSPVAVALSPSSTIAAIPELIKTLDPKGRIQAIADLDRLDRGVLGPATLADLSEAYRLLGQAERALKAATTLSSLDPKSSAGTAQSILVMTQSGNYAAAQATAESGLKRFPGDKDLLALLHQVKGRGVAIAPIVTEAGKSSAKPI